ncbi:MAG: tRNA 4-thiouridine(8) synthase ThiI [Euryarchaeota archaeon]|nr:tRNA 4-thiouridine(8) synthase ThiI [Euryarchaeota archaeon]
MQKNKLIIVRYGEIGIKSPKVRRRFEKKLISNIKSIIDCEIQLDQGRIFLYPMDLNRALESLKKIFGIVSFSPAIATKTDFDFIKELLENYIKELINKGLFSNKNSFAIRSRRIGSHDFTSRDMASFCGSVVVDMTKSPVDLDNPDFELFVEVRGDKTYIYHQKIAGLGGLPLGTQGTLVALLSGGIDSPVAAFLMMKRGCKIIALHFNNSPYTSPKSSKKALNIAKKLKEYSAGSKLDFLQVDYGEFLKNCIEMAPERLTCVLCKRGMYKIAEEIAEKEKALGIIDGSSLGQVASQTLPNLMVTRYSISTPIFSPLIGFDKVEIERLAKEIGTYPISILPDHGCTAVPKYPETKAELQRVLEVQEKMGIDKELENAMLSVKKMKI